MTNNPVTDEQNLVESISVQSFWGIFNRVYTVEDGFSLEIFRGRTYLGSILSNDITSNTKSRYQRFGLQKNDTVLRVNLGYRPLNVKCQLAMKDGWVRPYEGIVKIAVNNPYLFALQYQQATDPVELAKLTIEDAIKRYAQRTNHDNIDDNTLRYEMRFSLAQGVHKNYGLEVVEVLSSNIYLDPKRAEMLSIRQQGMVNNTQIRADADNALIKEQHDQQLQSFKNASGRDEDTLQRQHDRQQAFLDAASEGLKQNMLREISEGVSPEVLARRYPQYAQLLGLPVRGGTLPPHQPGLLNEAPQQTPTNTYSNAVPGNFTVVPQPSDTPMTGSTPSTQPFYNTQLGVWFVYSPLSDRQRQTWGVSNQTAFMVSSLDPDGIADKGYMMPGDMVIEVNEQPVQSEKLLLNALDSSQPGTPLSIRVLRGGQPYDLDLDIS